MQSRIIDPRDLIKKKPILKQIDLGLCVDCKAVKNLCGLPRCPLIEALDVYPDGESKIEGIEKSTNSIFGPTPQIFIGSQGYPKVNSGPMTSITSNTTHAKKAADPSTWADLKLKDIIDLRFGLLRGKKNVFIKRENKTEKLYDQLQQLTLSINPVDVESKYMGKLNLDPKFDIETQPMGPSGNLASLDIASNPKIPRKVDYVINDELNANEQMMKLYKSNFSVYYLQNIFSAGTTGLSENRRLVPTKWSITATDDILGKQLIPKLQDFSEVNNIEVRHNNLLGNYYTVILLPGNWTFENYETWSPGGIFTLGSDKWSTSLNKEGFEVKEHYKGRTSYASQAGGYYASRLAVLEHLHSRNKQARVVVIREISPEYVVPVGVWQVREGMRKTMRSKCIKFDNRQELYLWLETKLLRDFKYYINKSTTFTQRTLGDFFTSTFL